MSYIVVFASSRNEGSSTRRAVDYIFKDQDYKFVDFSSLNISPFDYEHKNAGDDFIPLMEELAGYDTIVLASPVYWYSVSAQMKIFLDRWTDLLTIRKDLGEKLEGKRLFLISSFKATMPLGCMSFEQPIRLTCHYLNLHYGGCYYNHPPDPYISNLGLKTEEEFRKDLFSSSHQTFRLEGESVSLRLATMADRQDVFECLYKSETTQTFVDTKTYEDFKKSWHSYYFHLPLTSRGHVFVIEKDGEGIGAFAFHTPDSKNRSEVDICLKEEKFCTQGLGSEALNLGTRFLYRELGIEFFWMQASERNFSSVEMSLKNNFKKLPLTKEDAFQEFGKADHPDSVYLLKDMSLG